MAGDWIKFELATLDKPEVYQLAELAGIDPDAVVGKLLRIWGWFDQQTESGNAPSVSKKLLDRCVGVCGFCDFMKCIGWMHEAGGCISLPHFERHNGKTGKNRALTAKRVASHKARTNAATVSEALAKEDNTEDQHPISRGGPKTAAGPAACAMALDWLPDPQLLEAYAARMAIAVEHFTPETMGAFVCHYSASGRCETQAAWVSLLVRWVKRDVEAAGSVRSFPARRPTTEPDFDDSAWAQNLVVRP